MPAFEASGRDDLMEPKSTKQTGSLFVVSGPSGSGKSTLCKAAAAQAGAHLSVSATTRPPGSTEIDGKDYYFIGEDDFLAEIQAQQYLEYARVFDYYYGTPAQPVMEKLDQGQTVVLEIDVQGGEQVFEKFSEAIGVLIVPPSLDEMKRRLCDRGRDDPGTINKRLDKAWAEVERAQSNQHYRHKVVNDDLDKSIAELTELFGALSANQIRQTNILNGESAK